MPGVRLQSSSGWIGSWLLHAAFALLAGCSLTDPSLDAYARARPVGSSGAGGSGGDGLAAGGDAGGTSNAGGTSSVSLAGEAGMGGAPPTGSAISFSGSQLVRVAPGPTDDLTIELWVRTKMFGPGGDWFSGAALFDADADGSANDFGATLSRDRFAFGTGNPDVTVLSKTPINTGEWVHVAASREMATGMISLYVNGALEATGASGNTGPLSQAVAPGIGGLIGKYGYENGLVGEITEVRLWNIVRSAGEMAATLHTRLRGDEPGLVGYWRFEDGAGLIAVDSSLSKNDGTLGDGYPELIPDWSTYSPPLIDSAE